MRRRLRRLGEEVLVGVWIAWVVCMCREKEVGVCVERMCRKEKRGWKDGKNVPSNTALDANILAIADEKACSESCCV